MGRPNSTTRVGLNSPSSPFVSSHRPTMLSPKFITYDAEHQFISCTLHQYALLPSTVLSHLNNFHQHDTKPSKRRALRDEVIRFASNHVVRTSYYNFVTDTKRKTNVIPSLKLHQHCHQCNYCKHIRTGSTKEFNIKAYLQEYHNVRGP